MSVVKFVKTVPPKVGDLLKRLTTEYRHPQEGDVEPLLMEERNRLPQETIRLYVIWGDWKDLDLRERSEIIMDAYEDAKGRHEALKVTFAMGLTKEEAQRMKITYQQEA